MPLQRRESSRRSGWFSDASGSADSEALAGVADRFFFSFSFFLASTLSARGRLRKKTETRILFAWAAARLARVRRREIGIFEDAVDGAPERGGGSEEMADG